MRTCLSQSQQFQFSIATASVEHRKNYSFTQRVDTHIRTRYGARVWFGFCVQLAVVFARVETSVKPGHKYNGHFPPGFHSYDDVFCEIFINLDLLRFSSLRVCPVCGRVQWCCVGLKQHDVVLCKVESAKVPISHEVILQQLVDKRLLVNMVLRGYYDLFVSIIFQRRSGFFFSASVLVTLCLSICARFIVHGPN